jgi:hypothetical protein
MKIIANVFKGDDGKTQLLGVKRNISQQHTVEKERDELLLEQIPIGLIDPFGAMC